MFDEVPRPPPRPGVIICSVAASEYRRSGTVSEENRKMCRRGWAIERTRPRPKLETEAGSAGARGLALARACLSLPALVGVVLGHVGHGADGRLHQKMPRFMMWIGSRYEHVLMRAINFLATRNFISNSPALDRATTWIGDQLLKIVSGEVLNVEEAKQLARAIAEEGHTVATGTCPCRRAVNRLSDDVPNNTDMVFGEWAETYMRNYPGLYRALTADEACELIEEFDRHGFIHQIYGYMRKAGAAYVMCNCDPAICIPLVTQKKRGIQAFSKGTHRARVDTAACRGIEECGACIERCPFDARSQGPDGKSSVDADVCFGCGVCVVSCTGEATVLERRKGARLAYAAPFVK